MNINTLRQEKSTTAVSGPFKHWNTHTHNPKTNRHPRHFTLLMLWWGGRPKRRQKKKKNLRVERENRDEVIFPSTTVFFLSSVLIFFLSLLKEKSLSLSLDVHWEQEKGRKNTSHIVFLSSIKFNSSLSLSLSSLLSLCQHHFFSV